MVDADMARPVKTLSTSAEALIPYRYAFIVPTCLILLRLAQSSLAAVMCSWFLPLGSGSSSIYQIPSTEHISQHIILQVIASVENKKRAYGNNNWQL